MNQFLEHVAPLIGVSILAIVVGIAAYGLLSLPFNGRDDGWSPIGDAAPPPPRRSPFRGRRGQP